MLSGTVVNSRGERAGDDWCVAQVRGRRTVRWLQSRNRTGISLRSLAFQPGAYVLVVTSKTSGSDVEFAMLPVAMTGRDVVEPAIQTAPGVVAGWHARDRTHAMARHDRRACRWPRSVRFFQGYSPTRISDRRPFARHRTDSSHFAASLDRGSFASSSARPGPSKRSCSTDGTSPTCRSMFGIRTTLVHFASP